jgi:intein/homing endonuclease
MNKLYNISDATVNMACMPAGTKIMTKTGYREIQDISVGDKVFTHKGRFKKVLKTFQNYNKNCEMVEITPFNLKSPIHLTHDHPVYVVKRNEMKNSLINENEKLDNMKWVNAADIEKGDLVFLPELSEECLIFENEVFDMTKYVPEKFKEYYVNYPMIKDNKLYTTSNNCMYHLIPLTNDLSYFMGRWCGDGYGKTISFDKKYGIGEVQNVGRIVENVFGCTYNIEELESHYVLRIMGGCESTLINFLNSKM